MTADDSHLLIRETIKSVWALELLLLMCREPRRLWSAAQLNRELRGSLSLVETLLETFTGSGLTKRSSDGRYRYGPATPELERAVRDLQAAYAARPLSVVKAILAEPNERIRAFADAFKVKKD